MVAALIGNSVFAAALVGSLSFRAPPSQRARSVHACSIRLPSDAEFIDRLGAPLFVDDDVRECCDPKVAAVPGLTRVLYARGS